MEIECNKNAPQIYSAFFAWYADWHQNYTHKLQVVDASEYLLFTVAGVTSNIVIKLTEEAFVIDAYRRGQFWDSICYIENIYTCTATGYQYIRPVEKPEDRINYSSLEKLWQVEIFARMLEIIECEFISHGWVCLYGDEENWFKWANVMEEPDDDATDCFLLFPDSKAQSDIGVIEAMV